VGLFGGFNAQRQQINELRQLAKQVQRPSIRDAIDLRRDPTKAFQATPEFGKQPEIPQSPGTARIVARRPTSLFKGNDTLVALSLMVMPKEGTPYAVAVESGVPDAMLSRCSAGAAVPVTYHRDDRVVVTVDWGDPS
jgi:hypothetical protein